MKAVKGAFTNGWGTLYTFKELKKTTAWVNQISLYLSEDGSNCKLSYIHQGGQLSSVEDDKEKKEIVDYLLTQAKGCIILNTTNKKVYEFIAKTYEVYYKHEVPIGYSNGYQYHICFKNTVKPNAYCRKPKAADTGDIKDKLLKILKDKRRKADYVDEFIKSL
jgi:hypothetical protein